MTMSPEEEKFGISLPQDVLEELEEHAKKMGKSRSALIKDIVTETIKRTKEESQESVRIDENACVRRLIADSEGIGFDMDGECARRAVLRDLTSDEWDPEKYPQRLQILLQRQKENDDYWNNGEDRRHERLNNFGDTVGIDRKTIKRIAKEIGYIK